MSTAIEQIFKETEIKCRNWVEKVPDGVYEASSFLDHDGLGGDDTVPVHARITVAGRDMSIDLSGCSDERKSSVI